jgi:cyclophilin family peptidyl-prolyl cis-trans isomerase
MLFLALSAAAFASLPARAENTVVVMETSLGTIKIELFDDKVPRTVKNFLSYVDDKFFDDVIFHRVIGKENSKRDFMIQTGGYTTGMKEKKTKAPIKHEINKDLSNTRGTVSMALKPGDLDSGTSQFFINLVDNSYLDKMGHAVFGKVTDGMDIVEKIKAVKTTGDGGRPVPNQPTEDVKIKSIRREKK